MSLPAHFPSIASHGKSCETLYSNLFAIGYQLQLTSAGINKTSPQRQNQRARLATAARSCSSHRFDADRRNLRNHKNCRILKESMGSGEIDAQSLPGHFPNTGSHRKDNIKVTCEGYIGSCKSTLMPYGPKPSIRVQHFGKPENSFLMKRCVCNIVI